MTADPRGPIVDAIDGSWQPLARRSQTDQAGRISEHASAELADSRNLFGSTEIESIVDSNCVL